MTNATLLQRRHHGHFTVALHTEVLLVIRLAKSNAAMPKELPYHSKMLPSRDDPIPF
jgi:hypothetical protein